VTIDVADDVTSRVLVVDDVVENHVVYRAVLAELRVEIVSAHSGAEALRQVLEREFAVILLDVNMPDMSGFETAAMIRRRRKIQHTPIIFVTAYADELRAQEAYSLGAVDYIVSPVVPAILRSKVAVFVELDRMRVALARSHRLLEARVAERTRELTETNARLEAEIAERVRVEEQRENLLDRERALRAAAEDGSRLKDEFLATLSHELRTPLNAIVGWTAVLRTGKLEAAAVGRAVDIIERNVWSQKQLIDDLLDVSRIVAGTFDLEMKSINLRQIVSDTVEAFQPIALQRDVTIVPALDTSSVPLRGDPHRLQQVVSNLISNAVKFTPAGGQVDVALACRDSHVEITVADTGEGIAPEFLPHVFDRFRQQDGSTARRHGGLGLGLAIARDLVALHGGTIQATSAGAGKGALFTVRLPTRSQVPEEAARPQPDADGALKLLEGIHVLAVDDDGDALEALRIMLERAGATVTGAHAVREALALLLRDRPDVLVADIGMPDLDGYALIELVRSLDPDLGGRTPAVALTAHASLADRLRALDAGYQHHLGKPVHPEDLAVVTLSAVRVARETAGTPARRTARRPEREAASKARQRRG
jgi:signal transduction histidine kinase